jgi:hypothetical protein
LVLTSVVFHLHFHLRQSPFWKFLLEEHHHYCHLF